MIGLFSTAVDPSTTDVLRWIGHLSSGTAVVRVNSDEPERVTELHVTNDDVDVVMDDSRWTVDDLTSVWYRKGHSWLCNIFPPVDSPVEPQLRRYLAARVRLEQQRLSELVHSRVVQRAWCLGHPDRGDLHKLMVLAAAEELGFDVPSFLVTTSRERLVAAVGQSDLVTKPLSDGIYFFDHDIGTRGYYSYTEALTREQVDGLTVSIPPSLVQSRVSKTLELRVFFLDGRSYAMAIFSQADDRTRVDFRRYNDIRPNRAVPYKLPVDVETRLRQLFLELGLNTGSADMILDDEGRYIFLEINPSGQFAMVSGPCNYYLEREVAATLIRHERRP